MRYLGSHGKTPGTRMMIAISLCGIIAGNFALTLALSVTRGFEKEVENKLRGMNSDAIVYAPNKLVTPLLAQHLEKTYPTLIAHSAPQSEQHILIGEAENLTVCQIKAVDPQKEPLVSSTHRYISLPGPTSPRKFESMLQEDGVIIGARLASKLNATIGTKIKLQAPSGYRKNTIKLKSKTAVVRGIFKTGLDEYDRATIICSFKTFERLFEITNGVSHIALTLNQSVNSTIWEGGFFFNKNKSIIERLRKTMAGVSVSSWQELYPSVMASLRLEKYAMTLVLGLIALVALITTAALLLMVIQRRRKDIALLFLMGARPQFVQSIFFSIGGILVTVGTLLGALFAASAAYLLERYQLIKLPDVYYTSYLPASMEIHVFLVPAFGLILLGLLICWAATKSTNKVDTISVLKNQ
jgi:ABC-type lipoprotein release transport system permease subunit